MLSVATIVSVLVFGIFLGLIYALMSVGISIIFGLMKLINFSHGEIYMLGGYLLFYFVEATGVSSIVALPIAFLGGFAIGSGIEAALIRPTYTTSMDKPSEYAIIVTFGLSLFLQNFALFAFGFRFKVLRLFGLGRFRWACLRWPEM